MFNRKLALVLCLLSAPAWAQNTQCSNRPAGDSTNACANTRFVTSAIPTIASACLTFLTTPSSANLAACLTDETGTAGFTVFSNSPVLVTPTLGAATATTINGVTLDNNGWTSYTPIVTSQTGTCTSCPATGRSKQIGKTVFLETDMQVTTVGTASGIMLLTLPTSSAAFRYAGSCFEYGATLKSGGASLAGTVDTTRFQTVDATGNTFFGANAKVVCSITYEIP